MRLTRVMILGLAMVWMSGTVCFGQGVTATVSYSANTGDAGFNTVLSHLNVSAQANLTQFVNHLSVSYHVSTAQVENLIHTVKIAPADVYMIVSTAHLIGKPVEVVVNEYHLHKAKGWGAIAKSLGIKPGSKQFHALKNGGVIILEKTKGKEKKDKHEDKPHKEHKKSKEHEDHGKGHGKNK